MDARFRSNLEMIGRNEPITKKAKFWQSYVRSLKGTDDLRAPEHTHRPRGIFRSEFPELHSTWPFTKSIYEDPLHAADRIHSPGYRYLPVHRDIYGYTPRQIYPHQYKPVERFVPAKPFNPRTAWNDQMDKIYPVTPLLDHRKTPLLSRHKNLTPLLSMPILTKPLFDVHGRNIMDDIFPSFPNSLLRGRTKPLNDLLEPSPFSPVTAFSRDPFWYPDYAPYIPSYAQHSSPFYLRDSYLSPVKRNYLWSRHPLRPFDDYQESFVNYYSKPVPLYHCTNPWYNRH